MITKEEKIKRITELDPKYTVAMLKSLNESTIDNMLIVARNQFARAVQEQAFEMA
ncbi:hypothetical protein [Companilactobacillus sp. DQM5]|uniref:hypothetical protein n=1 Tax=Companilactobacillus sp. DQM5 TaxID=3463359 RepID=UPI00405A1EB7